MTRRKEAPAIGTNCANHADNVSPYGIDYHAAKAQGGPGLIPLAATVAAPLAQARANQLALWSDEHLAGFKNVVDKCHQYGARVSVQLHYPDREAATLAAGVQPVASAHVASSQWVEIPPELTTEKIYEIIQKFADAARRCRAAGADAVEIQAAPGYIVGRFLSSRWNKRADEFGGNLQNRLRFLLLIIQGIRQQVGTACPIIIRTGDLSITEISAVVSCLEDAGVRALLVSTNSGYLACLAEKIKKSAKTPVIIKFLLLPLADSLNLMAQRIFCRLARRI